MNVKTKWQRYWSNTKYHFMRMVKSDNSLRGIRDHIASHCWLIVFVILPFSFIVGFIFASVHYVWDKL